MALCSYRKCIIEAIVSQIGRTMFPGRFLIRRLFGINKDEENIYEKEYKIDVKSEEKKYKIKLKLGKISKSLELLRRYGRHRHLISLTITGIDISRHDQAVKLLEKLSNSLFSQIDLAKGIPLVLEKERRPKRHSVHKKKGSVSRIFSSPETNTTMPQYLYIGTREAQVECHYYNFLLITRL